MHCLWRGTLQVEGYAAEGTSGFRVSGHLRVEGEVVEVGQEEALRLLNLVWPCAGGLHVNAKRAVLPSGMFEQHHVKHCSYIGLKSLGRPH